jgi:RND family efflux transporter MFP subunit
MHAKRTPSQRILHFMRLFSFALVVMSISIPITYYINAQQIANAPKPNIRRFSVDRGTLTLSVNATGAVAAERSAKLNFDNPGVVTEIFVRDGQRVLERQLLARQDDQAYRLAVIQAEAGLRVAQLQLEQLQQPPSAKDLTVAEANVKAAKDSYASLFSVVDPNAVAAARLRYEQAQISQQGAIQNRRDVGGRVGGKEDDPRYQLALAQEGQASFATEAARLQLELLQRGVDARIANAAKQRITLAEAELARLKAGPLPIQIDQANLRIQQAEAVLAQAKRELATTELRAPIAGEISVINLRVGGLAVISGALPGIVVLDRAQLRVNINVDEIDIGQVQENQLVSLTLDALPGETFAGRVQRIAPAPNPATGTVVTYQVQVGLPDGITKIKPGMTTSGSIVVRQLENVLRVPNSYVRLDRRNNQTFVNLVNPDSTLTEIPISLGLRTEDYSEVIGGLNEGDIIGVNLNSAVNLFGGN